jgi:hypothetical protein
VNIPPTARDTEALRADVDRSLGWLVKALIARDPAGIRAFAELCLTGLDADLLELADCAQVEGVLVGTGGETGESVRHFRRWIAHYRPELAKLCVDHDCGHLRSTHASWSFACFAWTGKYSDSTCRCLGFKGATPEVYPDDGRRER